MNSVDVWAAAAASVAAWALATRGHMLKPHQSVWAGAPAPVWTSLVGLAIGLGMGVVTILGGAHATPREAVVYTLLAVSAVIMTWNLHRHGRGPDMILKLHGRAGLITTFESRLDPEARAIFRRHAGAAGARKRACK